MNENGRITTPFDSTAAEVVAGIDLAGKRAVVTGAGSGIGVESARALAGAGAAVTMAVRRTGDAEAVAADIRATTGNDAVAVAPLELTDRASIAAFVEAWDGQLDILVNNAGVMAIQGLTLSDRGHEMQFATNHLGHFALALGRVTSAPMRARSGAGQTPARNRRGFSTIIWAICSSVTPPSRSAGSRDFEIRSRSGCSSAKNGLWAMKS
jgi:NAD(P)-dependent dehydrogenase (short-subunit alcohol dehydrogenase family)